MPGQPRDSYDTVVRKLAELDRRMEIAERHRHPTGRNTAGPVSGLTDYVVAYRTSALTVANNSLVDLPLQASHAAAGTIVSWSGAVFTVSVTGLYQLSVWGAWIANGSAGTRAIQWWASPSAGVGGEFFDGRPGDTGIATVNTFSMPLYVSAGTTFTLKAYQNSGSNCDLYGHVIAGVALLSS